MPLVHPDHREYLKFTGKARLDKALNTLVGLVQGIALDGRINADEVNLLRLWVEENRTFCDRHPYNEFIPVLDEALVDGILTSDERDDILYVCEKLTSLKFVGDVTADIQKLHGVLGGIMADGTVTEDELHGLTEWLTEHEHLKTVWPYDEVEALVLAVMKDGKIDGVEQKQLQNFFSEFLAILDNRTITSPQMLTESATLTGICSVAPEIKFDGTLFCFTGASNRMKRNDFKELVSKLGADANENVSKKTNYLVIGADGNPAWAYACYGRKVEKAVMLRKEGVRIVIVHELDFHDAVADLA